MVDDVERLYRQFCRPMRVLHMTKVQGIGGAEQHLLQLLPSLRERGIDARFLSLDAGGDAGRFHRALDERGVPWHRVRCGMDVSPRLAVDVGAAVRTAQPDLIHTHMVHADVYGSIAAQALRRRFVSTRHNDDRYLLGPFRHVDRLMMRHSRKVIAISDAVRTFHVEAGLPAQKLVTIHYGLDTIPTAPSELTPEQAGIPADAPLLLAVGRLIEQKDHATLLDAFALVHERRPGARLAILGWGRLEGELKAQRSRLGLDEAVLLPGRVEPAAWLRAGRHLRPHIEVGGLRDRAARSDARRLAGRRDTGSAPSPRSWSTAARACSSNRGTRPAWRTPSAGYSMTLHGAGSSGWPEEHARSWSSRSPA